MSFPSDIPNSTVTTTTESKYQGDPALCRPSCPDFVCRERLVSQDDLIEFNDDGSQEDDDSVEYYGRVVAFECTYPLRCLRWSKSSSSASSSSSIRNSNNTGSCTHCTSTSTSSSSNITSRSLNWLTFWCREPSCGVLLLQDNETHVASAENGNENKKNSSNQNSTDLEGYADPNFFDAGYTAAGKTGFQVWPGSRLIVETLLFPIRNTDGGYRDCLALQKLQRALLEQELRIVELGAGVGVVGCTLAAASPGVQVLMTDLPTLVHDSLWPNLRRNANFTSANTTTSTNDTPDWLLSISARPLQINRGWVASTSLDWSTPTQEQLSNEQLTRIDWIIASDCVWLTTMLNSLLDSVQAMFNTSPQSTLLMSFQRRDPKPGEAAHMFTTVDQIIRTIKDERKWDIQCLAWQPVVYTHSEDGQDNEEAIREVFLFQITPPRHET